MSNIVDRTLEDFANTLEGALRFSENGNRQAPAGISLTTGAKIAITIIMLFTVSLSRRLPQLLMLHLIILCFAYFAGLNIRYLLKRAWILMPFFTVFIALPAIFSAFTPGRILVTFSKNPEISVTYEGLAVAFTLVLRVADSVATVLLLIMSTPWNSIMETLGRFGIPSAFITILAMTHRYVYDFLFLATNMFQARKSRMVGKITSGENRYWIGAVTGTLLDKSLYLSSEVYLAMKSRGLGHALVSRKKIELSRMDLTATFAVIILCAIVLLF